MTKGHLQHWNGDMGLLMYCLRVKFEQNREAWNQSESAMLCKYGHQTAWLGKRTIQCQHHWKLLRIYQKSCNGVIKNNLLMSMIYMTVWTRPDLSHAVSLLSQLNRNLTQQRWTGAKVLRYFKASEIWELTFKNKNIFSYVDADSRILH